MRARAEATVKLYVVRDDPTADESDLQRHCALQLTAYKCPAHRVP